MAVNAPEAGTIKEFLVKEEDTVTVGQDLLRLELGGAPSSSGDKAEAKSEPKQPASDQQKTSSQPDGSKEKEAPQSEKQVSKSSDSQRETKPSSEQQSKSAPPPQEKPTQKTAPAPKEEKATSSKDDSPFGGSREERRVSLVT